LKEFSWPDLLWVKVHASWAKTGSYQTTPIPKKEWFFVPSLSRPSLFGVKTDAVWFSLN
jgi:hypothetical protein